MQAIVVLEGDQTGQELLEESLRVLSVDVIGVELGFPRFENPGEPFDPSRHEAVGTTDADAPAGTVVAVVRPGYGTPEHVLRPAAVVVARP